MAVMTIWRVAQQIRLICLMTETRQNGSQVPKILFNLTRSSLIYPFFIAWLVNLVVPPTVERWRARLFESLRSVGMFPPRAVFQLLRVCFSRKLVYVNRRSPLNCPFFIGIRFFGIIEYENLAKSLRWSMGKAGLYPRNRE